MSKQAILARPRGFCAGVIRAVEIVELALKVYGAPVYVLHEIVHNQKVLRDLEADGAVFVQALDSIPFGALTIFSAHGVAARVVEEARRRGLRIIDATCPLVSKVHLEVAAHARAGREVVLALSGNEETDGTTAAKMAEELKNAELVLNDDAGGGQLDSASKPIFYTIQVAEKTYADFTLTITDAGGHSSRPTKTNAIYRLSADLQKLAAYSFPVMKSEITVAMFKATGPITPGPLGEAMKRYAANPDDASAIAAFQARATMAAPTRVR